MSLPIALELSNCWVAETNVTSERLDRIGELLAKGVYLYLKNEKSPEQDDLKEKKKISRTLKQSEAVVQK